MTVSGNLVSDVTLGATTRGDAMARFRMASTTKRYDRATGQWLDGDTTYWNVTAWRRAAENAATSLAKGHPVVVLDLTRCRAQYLRAPIGPQTSGVEGEVTPGQSGGTHDGQGVADGGGSAGGAAGMAVGQGQTDAA